MDGSAQPVDAGAVGEVDRDERRRLAAGGADPVVERLQRLHLAADRDHVRTVGGEAEGDRLADAARRAGDDGDTALQRRQVDCGQWVAHPAFSRNESCATGLRMPRSVSGVGYSPVKQASQYCGVCGSRRCSPAAR